MGVPKPMTHYPYILFNQTPDSLRRIGARGGQAQARNRRARRADLPAPPGAGSVPLPEPARETTAQAIAALEAQFPWLRQPLPGASHRRANAGAR
jgi:hypothetical protein